MREWVSICASDGSKPIGGTPEFAAAFRGRLRVADPRSHRGTNENKPRTEAAWAPVGQM